MRLVGGLVWMLLLVPFAGCLGGPLVPAFVDAEEAVGHGRNALPGWDLIYLSASGSTDRPHEADTWSIGMAQDGQVAIVVVRGDGVRISNHPGEDRVVHGGEVVVEGPWSDGGAAHPTLGSEWNGLAALPEPDGLHWIAFLHGAIPRWERLLVSSDGTLSPSVFDARSGEELDPARGLSGKDAVQQWRASGGEGEVTGLFGVDFGAGFQSANDPWQSGVVSQSMPLLLKPDGAADGRSSQWLLAVGNATWRVDATGSVPLEDGLLEASAALGDWVDSTATVGAFDHSGTLFLHADEPVLPVWSLRSRSGDALSGGDFDARPVPVLWLEGTIEETGPFYFNPAVCGQSLPMLAVDVEQQRIEHRPAANIHPSHALFVADDARLRMISGSGCSHQLRLQSANDTLTTPWDGLTIALESKDAIRVGESLLQPGSSVNVTVHWSVEQERYGVDGTWDYDGVLQVRWLGDWPRGNITATYRT